MGRAAALLYGVAAYALFLVAFLYAIGFLAGFGVPKAINDGPAGPAGTAVLVNVLLLGLFAVQHTIMARPAFKDWWTKFVPRPIERSTFVLAASGCLLLLFWLWRPLPGVVWRVDNVAGRLLLVALSMAGWGLVLYSSFLIDHFDLFGLRQVVLHARRMEYHHHPFVERSLYRFIRHPLMAGFIIAFWATPDMTAGHLLFAGVSTAYILFGITIEERDLGKFLGDDYAAYRRRTPMLIPRPGRQ
jgi:protein-S-isoprenylcysteine O-methyltransferase Ste14